VIENTKFRDEEEHSRGKFMFLVDSCSSWKIESNEYNIKDM
jgi:hypothetical protein